MDGLCQTISRQLAIYVGAAQREAVTTVIDFMDISDGLSVFSNRVQGWI